SDPYGRALLSGVEKARTVTCRNNLNPEWDEILYVPVHSPRDRLQLEVMDAETVGKDRSLGLVDVFAGEYITQGEMGEYLPNDKKTPREDGLRIHGKGIAKGVLNYTVAFYPCLNVADHEEEEEEGKETEKEKEGEEEKKAQEGAGEEKKPLLDATTRSAEASGESSSTSLRKSDEDAADTPKTPTSQRKSGEERGPPKVRLSPEELLKYDTGLVIFRLMDAELPKGQTHVEIFVDDMAYPSYTSSTAQTRTFKFDEIGDCLIRELEFSRLTLKVREKGESHEEDHTLARLTGNTLDTLKQCLVSST
ncbi:MAG: hypothetical protein OK454_08085, partial [Thaumarchaeota archaeon]|nr:hypothetical protein [Nitrososphaerota archaeon]